MKIFLISNLYPSVKFPAFGTFVKEFEDAIILQGGDIICKAVIDRKHDTKYGLLGAYILLYLKIMFLGIFREYDLIYVHYIAHTSFPVWMLSFIKRRKIILNVHGDDILPRTSLVLFFQKIIKQLLKRTDLVVVPSSFFKEIFLERFRFDEDNIYIYPSGGIDHNIFRKRYQQKMTFGFKEDDIILGFVSRLTVGKNWQLFVECVKRMNKINPHYKGLLVGAGEDSITLIKMLSENNLSKIIHFEENIPHIELAKYYSIMDIFIFPSTLSESLGLVGLEAMSCSIPVIGSNLGGIKTYIRDGFNGYLFTPNKIDDLIEKIKLYIGLLPQEKKKIRSNALLTASRYDSVKCTTELYKKMIHLMADFK